jgi:hypothetical protein
MSDSSVLTHLGTSVNFTMRGTHTSFPRTGRVSLRDFSIHPSELTVAWNIYDRQFDHLMGPISVSLKQLRALDKVVSPMPYTPAIHTDT